ncbi:MAG: glycosyltransferase [Candidatus Omnitrophota bacterium]
MRIAKTIWIENKNYSRTTISIVIPLYNECMNVRALFSLINNALKDRRENYVIIFVDDGSTDDAWVA